MKPILENITFGTFTAIVMGVILCCLICVVSALVCCKKKLTRQSSCHSSRAVTDARTDTLFLPPCDFDYELGCSEDPPRYEDLDNFSDPPPPYQPPTLLVLSQAKLTARHDFQSSSSTIASQSKTDPKGLVSEA